jgi:hypothetical protein
LGQSQFFDNPVLVFGVSLLGLGLAAFLGALGRRMIRPLHTDELHEYDVVQTATLTLLGLLVGFSFSMAINRYDTRKSLEEAEANAIGTQFLRADLLPAGTAVSMREDLTAYLAQRILFYSETDEVRLAQAEAETTRLQANLWRLARSAAVAQPTPITALAVAGMNDVLNAQGFTQSAWWNRIPPASWLLMALIAFGCNLLLGYGARRINVAMFFVVPLTISISFLLIADIDSPRGGLIRVLPRNLTALAHSLDLH